MKRYINIIFLIVLFFFMINNYVYAEDENLKQIDNLITGMNGVNKITIEADSASKIDNILKTVITLIRVIGSGISLIVVTLLGIKYIMASANEKADLKKQAVPIIIGCVLLFAGSNIAAIIVSFGNELN